MITLSGLEKSFSRQKVLHDISLTIPEGSVTALIGPSGSGKVHYYAALIYWKSRRPGN
jgi:cystine transport system ATP-binding protein